MKKALVISLFMFLIPLSVFAHSGKTNSDGGHYDSSTGEYHYHHGYSAHSHNNGICPYDDQADVILPSYQSGAASTVVNTSYEDGYDDGYYEGSHSGYDEGYYDGYETGYQEGEQYAAENIEPIVKYETTTTAGMMSLFLLIVVFIFLIALIAFLYEFFAFTYRKHEYKDAKRTFEMKSDMCSCLTDSYGLKLSRLESACRELKSCPQDMTGEELKNYIENIIRSVNSTEAPAPEVDEDHILTYVLSPAKCCYAETTEKSKIDSDLQKKMD